MWLIPSMFKNHLWDWSRRCPQVTYGIIPIYFSESVLGLIPLVSSSHQWDWSFRCLKIICGTDPWGVLKSPTRCRHSFINHNEGTSSRALWKWQHKYCQCPRACQTLIAIVPASFIVGHSRGLSENDSKSCCHFQKAREDVFHLELRNLSFTELLNARNSH